MYARYCVAECSPYPSHVVAPSFGEIQLDQVNEAFDTADGKFDPVSASDAIEFPLSAPDPEQATLQMQSAQALAQRALVVAYIGVGLGVVGVLAAVGER